MSKAIDVEATPIEGSRTALVKSESPGLPARMSLDELHENLEFIRNVMKQEMRGGQDYGKIPGCGEKPALFQPGAQKLCMTFQLTNSVKAEVVNEISHKIPGHREYAFTVTLTSSTGRAWDGVGTCSTMEAKYRYRNSNRKCPKCGSESILKSKKDDEGWFCWAKKGGCGARFDPSDPDITRQETGRTDNDNPADFWNTVRKMAFKRALVHATINATNTSELWTQDIEDIPPEPTRSGRTQPEPQSARPPSKAPQAKTSPQPRATDEQYKRFIKEMEPFREAATTLFKQQGWIPDKPNAVIEEIPLEHVPRSKARFNWVMGKIQSIADGGAEEPMASEPGGDVDPGGDWWRDFEVPFGNHEGIPLGELGTNVIYGFWANFEVETEYKGRPLPKDRIEQNRRFRQALDAAGEHYEFGK